MLDAPLSLAIPKLLGQVRLAYSNVWLPPPNLAEQLVLRQHLAALVVANHTLALTILEGRSDVNQLVGLLVERKARSLVAGHNGAG